MRLAMMQDLSQKKLIASRSPKSLATGWSENWLEGQLDLADHPGAGVERKARLSKRGPEK
jgi:hypothetical protein